VTRERGTLVAVPLLGAAGGVLARVALRTAGVAVPWAVAVLAGLAVGLLVALARLLPTADDGALAPPQTSVVTVSPGLGDLSALLFTLDGAARDPDRFEHRVRPRLAALAVELLWQRHAVDWRTPEGRAAAAGLLGPATTELLTAPRGALTPTPATVNRWLDELEAL
jgi:hypothetical protein